LAGVRFAAALVFEAGFLAGFDACFTGWRRWRAGIRDFEPAAVNTCSTDAVCFSLPSFCSVEVDRTWSLLSDG
jgi:hypothetical protein